MPGAWSPWLKGRRSDWSHLYGGKQFGLLLPGGSINKVNPQRARAILPELTRAPVRPTPKGSRQTRAAAPGANAAFWGSASTCVISNIRSANTAGPELRGLSAQNKRIGWLGPTRPVHHAALPAH